MRLGLGGGGLPPQDRRGEFFDIGRLGDEVIGLVAGLKRALDEVVVVGGDDEERHVDLRQKAMDRADLVIAVERVVEGLAQVGAAGGDLGVVGRDLGEVVAVDGIGGGQVGIVGEVVRQFASGRQERRGGIIPLGIGRTTAQRRAGAEKRDDLALL